MAPIIYTKWKKNYLQKTIYYPNAAQNTLKPLLSFSLQTTTTKKKGLFQRFQNRWDSPKKRWIRSKFLSQRFFSRRFKPPGNECGYRVVRPVLVLFKSAGKGIHPILALLKALV